MSNSPLILTLRFPGFSGEWEEKKLGDVFDFKPTNSLSRDKLNYEKGKIKNIHYGDIHTKFHSNFYINKEYVPYINDYIGLSKINSENYCRENDLIIADASEDYLDIGKSIEIRDLDNQKVLSGLHTLIARPKPNYFSQGYLSYLMRSRTIRLQVMRLAQGTKVLGISPRFLNKVSMNLPKTTEQQKIASFLEKTDSWIENLKQQKIELEKYKKGMMQKIYAQEIRFKNEKRNSFPEWEERKLENIGKSFNGIVGKSGEDFGEGQPFITYKQIFDKSEIDIYKFALVKIGSQEKQNKAKFGDIFFTTSSETPHEVGFSSVLLNREVTPYLNSFSFGFRPNNIEEFSPNFAKYFFRSSIYRRKVIRLAQGSTRYNISKIEFMKIKIELPIYLEQQKIADFLTSIDKVIQSKQLQISQAEKWKKGLMQGLFV